MLLKLLVVDKEVLVLVSTSNSAFHGHTHFSDVASDETYDKKLPQAELVALGYVFHAAGRIWDAGHTYAAGATHRVRQVLFLLPD